MPSQARGMRREADLGPFIVPVWAVDAGGRLLVPVEDGLEAVPLLLLARARVGAVIGVLRIG